MNRSIVSSIAVAVCAVGIPTASAQVSPEGSGAATLTPDQRAAIRIVIVERLTDEMQDRIPEGLAEAAAALSTLTPEQRAAVRSAIRARFGDDVREGLAERLSERLADR